MRERLSYANVTATVALFVALAGGAYAVTKLPANSVSSRTIKNGQVKSRDIGTGQVKGRNLAAGSVNSRVIKDGQVQTADIGDGAVASADIGDQQVNAANIGLGQVGSAQLAPAEAFHLVGAPGEPTFGNGGGGDCVWSNAPSVTPVGAAPDPVGFYEDPYGVVRLTGGARSQSVGPGCGPAGADGFEDAVIFALPAGDRPPNLLAFAVAGAASGATTRLFVNGDNAIATPAGTVPPGAVFLDALSGPTSVSLDGVSFRAAGAGIGISKR